MGIDLHTHSTRSDGTTTPSQTVQLAVEAGLEGIALTDHDTMAGWDEAAEACRRHGLRFVPGVELSTELDGRSVHLLGYYVDPTFAPLLKECDRLRTERLRRAKAIVAKLSSLGIDITLEDVVARAAGAPLGRPHIAAAIVAAGAVPDAEAAFDRYIADGGPAYEPKHALSPEDGVALIGQAGGVAVLAHPGLSTRDAQVDLDLLDRLVAVGLRGVEADHAAHETQVRDLWRAAALERGLVVTGASDFHGMRKETPIGQSTTSAAVVDTIEELAPTRGRGAVGSKEAAW